MDRSSLQVAIMNLHLQQIKLSTVEYVCMTSHNIPFIHPNCASADETPGISKQCDVGAGAGTLRTPAGQTRGWLQCAQDNIIWGYSNVYCVLCRAIDFSDASLYGRFKKLFLHLTSLTMMHLRKCTLRFS